MRRVLTVVCAVVLFCFGFGLFQAEVASAKENDKPKAAKKAKTAKANHSKKHHDKVKADKDKVKADKSETKADKEELKADKETKGGRGHHDEVQADKDKVKADKSETKADKEELKADKETKGGKKTADKAGKHRREPQAKSDSQLRQAQSLLTPPLSLQKLQQAKKLLSEADHDYDGHRVAAMRAIDKAINEYSSNPGKATEHLKEAGGELNIALGVR